MNYEITPPRGLVQLNMPELWRYRELLAIFVWRDLKVRYKQTALGVAWAVLQPVVMMIIYTVFFGRLAQLPSDHVPYPVFVFTGLLFWNYFATALTNASNCLIDNESIVKKVYFPRLILPVSTVVTPAVDYVISFVILLVVMLIYRFVPVWVGFIYLPFLLIVALFGALGIGLFLAAFNAKYRDVRFILPFFIQMLLFLTPVIYPVSLIPSRFQWLIYLNPMAGVISLARSALLGTTSVNWPLIGLSAISAIVLFVIGLTYFRKTERFFADVL